TGNVSIGPFSFVLNKKLYNTDSINIKIYPKLPTIKNGIWLREVNFKNDSYLIVEQRIAGQWETTQKDSNSFTQSFDPRDAPFTELDDWQIKNKGISFEFGF